MKTVFLNNLKPQSGTWNPKSSNPILRGIMAGLWLCAMIGFAPSTNGQTTNFFYEGFETAQALDDWSWDGPWEIGVPTSGPNAAYDGTNNAATVLAGDYADDTSGRLMSKSFVVPGADNNPRLRWAHWYAFNAADHGRLQVQVGAGPWSDLPGYPVLTGSGSGVWSEAAVDLSTYAGQTVRVGFLFTSGRSGTFGNDIRVGPGWFIDEVRVVTGPYSFNNPNGFEEAWGDWNVEGGTWEAGIPAEGVGPGQAHTGAQCVGTVLAGNYEDGFGDVTSSFGRLVSPPVVVPPAVTNPRLRFWNWHAFDEGDSGRVEIKVGTNIWQTIATYTLTSSGVWSRPDINLNAYAGQTIRIGFLYTSDRSGTFGNQIRVNTGWYIDEVRLLHDFSLALLDSPIMRAQDDTCISLAIAASTLTPTASFTLDAPAGHVGNLSLNTEGCWSGGLTALADSQWLVSLTNSCSTAVMGEEMVGTLCFTALSAQSAFVPLAISDLDAGVSPTHIFDSRAVVIANEPLLEAWLGASRERMATIYGIAGKTYEIRHATTPDAPSPWASGWTNTVPASLFISFPLADTDLSSALMAYEGFAYGTGSDLSGQSGGSGWSSAWTTDVVGDTVISSEPAGSLGYVDALGNALLTSGNTFYYTAADVSGSVSQTYRSLPAPRGADNTTTWVSLLGMRVGPTVNLTENPYPRAANLGLFSGDTEHLGIGNNTGAPSNTWAITLPGGLANIRSSTNSFSELSLVVLRIDHKPGNDDAYLFINPDLGSEPSLSSAAAQSLGSFDLSFNRIRPFVGGEDAANGRPYAEILLDEIRIGETYHSVTPFTATGTPNLFLRANEQ